MNAGTIIKSVVVVAAAMLLGWQSVKTATVNELVRPRPDAARLVAPNDPRADFREAMIEFARTKGTISEPATQAAINSVPRAPLADEPFFIAGLQAAKAGRRPQARALFEEARRRDGRSRVSRLFLLDAYLRERRIADAATEMTVLARLLPAAGNILVQELSRFATAPDSQVATREVLRGDPVMRTRVLEHLAQRGVEPATVLRVAGVSEGTVRFGGNERWAVLLLDSLVSKARYDEAHALWGRMSATRQDAIPFDGEFRGHAAPPPFNWRLTVGEAGLAEIGDEPGLSVEYYGRAATTLAEQLLRLPPGRHAMSVIANGEADGEASQLAWRIQCANASSPIAQMPLRELTFAPKSLRASFTVPVGCEAQWLRLVGIPGEFPKSQSATITGIGVRPMTPAS